MVILGVVVLISIWLIGLFVPKARSCYEKCKDNGSHSCTCCGVEHPLLIDGDSVKLGEKIFSSAEIKNLQMRDRETNVDTYTIFKDIDTATRECVFNKGK